jgi:hypothetical protein
MSIFENRRIIIALKLYICVALIVTAIFSNPLDAAAAILALLVFLSFQWRMVNIFSGLIVTYFIFFAIAILMAPITNFVISAIIALPVLFLVTNNLLNTARFLPRRITRLSRSLTLPGIVLPFIAFVNLIIALFLSYFALVLASSVAIIYLAILSFLSIKKLSNKSVVVEQVEERIMAGSIADLQVNLRSKTKIGGVLSIDSPYEWVKILSPVLLFKQDPLVLKMSVTPQLSGPSDVKVQVYASDCWGLTQVKFQLSPMHLFVIPRARYAAWLAKKYLETTKSGLIPLISNVNAVKPQYGLRRGVEYYGSQLYQPGDELKNIDWKHSAKYNKMISKEFIEFHGQPAVLLVNLSVRDEDEADELAYNAIMTALSLAREQIPTVLAAYDDNSVKLVTKTLQPHQLVVQSLGITREIKTFENPAIYLHTPDMTRLRANINRLALATGESAKVLSQLMNIEYTHLMDSIATSPTTKAINKALDNANIQSTIVVVSKLNHDANAIEVHKYLMARKGNPIVAV